MIVFAFYVVWVMVAFKGEFEELGKTVRGGTAVSAARVPVGAGWRLPEPKLAVEATIARFQGLTTEARDVFPESCAIYLGTSGGEVVLYDSPREQILRLRTTAYAITLSEDFRCTRDP